MPSVRQPTRADRLANRPPLPAGPAGASSRLARFLPAILIVAGLAIAYLGGWHEHLTLEQLARSRDSLAEGVSSHPVLAPLAFLFVYFLAVAFSLPVASLLTIFGGFLFGWLLASALVAVAATAGATALFLAARSAFGDSLRRRIGGKAAALAEGFERNAFGYLLALRLAPVLPFFVLNIAPALFDVRPRDYVVATFLGILPGVFAYSYLGQGLDSVLSAAEAAGARPALADLATPEITLALLALAVVALVPVIVRTVRR